MKTVKKLVGAILVGAMTLAMSATAFAATAGISTDEQKLLDKAKERAQELGVDTEASAEFQKYYSQATEYLVKNELTAAQISEASGAIDKAESTIKEVMKANNVTDLSDLKADAFADVLTSLKTKVVEDLQTVADHLGLDITLNADGTVKVVDNTGDTAGSNGGGPGKTKTGFDLTATVVVATAFVGAVAVCLVVASKKRFFEEA